MVKISDVNRTFSSEALKKIKKSGSAGGSDFAKALQDAAASSETSETSQASQAAPITNTNPLLGLQEVASDGERNKQAYQQGEMTLDALESLRTKILLGEASEEDLRRLAKMAQDNAKIVAADPRLARVMDEIELRAAVELAKLEQAREQRQRASS